MEQSKEQPKENFKVLRYILLALILWNIPAFCLIYVGSTVASILSYLSFGLIVLYVILNGKSGNNTVMLILGMTYFLIGALSNQAYMPDFVTFFIIVIKYFILIWGGYELIKKSTNKEISFYLLVGALSILGNMFLFNNPKADYGRYSGFYLDPNNAGLICSIGFAMTFTLNKKFRLLAKTFFTLLGLFTLSRTFILVWVVLNILSIRHSLKNIKMVAMGFAILSTLLIYNEFLPVKNPRLERIGAFITGNAQKSKGIDKDSRWDTWSRYYDALQDKPIFGNGYQAFSGNGVAPPVGVHNTYLLLWGDAGFIPALLFIFYVIWLIIESNKKFNSHPQLLMIITAISLFLLTNHNFMTMGYSLALFMMVHIKLKETNDIGILST